jgi:hypothetical protein
MIYSFSIITTEYLLEVILTHMAVPLKILYDQIDLFFGVSYLFRSTAQFKLSTSGENFQKGEFLFKDI